jgi:hypothetical protein
MHASVETYELRYRHGLCLPSVTGYPRRTGEEAYLQGKKLGVQVLRILENVNNLQPHVWIILQVAQYLVGSIPLKRKEGRGYSRLEVGISI